MKLNKKRGRFKVHSVRRLRRKVPTEAADYQAIAGDA